MIRLLHITAAIAVLGLSGCGTSPGGAYPPYQPQPRQGQYVYPEYLRPAVTPRIPRSDVCQSRVFLGLVGQHEGSIYIAGLPGRKRIIKPASLEEDLPYTEGIDPEPPYVQVRQYLPGQSLYAPSIRTTADLLDSQPIEEDRLTIELDREGYVQEVRCG